MLNRIVLIAILSVLALGALSAQEDFNAPGQVQVSQLEFLGKTPPLRTLVERPNTNPEKRKAYKANRPQITRNFQNLQALQPRPPKQERTTFDPLRQLAIEKTTNDQVEPFVNYNGIGYSNVVPPDPSVAVGKNHVVQMVNATLIEIYDKEGNVVMNEFSANSLWNSTGFQSAGDPVILYDHDADRWMITEFAPQGANTLLIAISETDDPTGSYYVYDFQTPNFPDYPKFGVWPDAYTVGTNELPSVPVYALERQKMLNGEENPKLIRVTANSLNAAFFPMLLPADWDGDTPPMPGTKPMFLRVRDGNFSDAVQIYTMTIDWDNPNNSSLDDDEVIIEDVDTE
ncbi:MAG: hypothetical protein KDC44_21520, partial [Phaeodactylibacter sp.]|nr:hypothetical protein [Phaeodactylibacter sp.]